MFWSKNKEKWVYPCIPHFIYVGFKRVYIAQNVFMMVKRNLKYKHDVFYVNYTQKVHGTYKFMHKKIVTVFNI